MNVAEAAVARHISARDMVAPALRPVLNLHGPVVAEDGKPKCAGCDPGWNAQDNPPWPCSTWLLITGQSRLRNPGE